VHPLQCTRGRWRAGPACQPGPLARAPRGERFPSTACRRWGLLAEAKGTNALVFPLRLDPIPLCVLIPSTASSPPTIANRRRCRGGAGHHTPVEHARATPRDSRSHGDHDARASEAREGWERVSQEHRRRGELRRGNSAPWEGSPTRRKHVRARGSQCEARWDGWRRWEAARCREQSGGSSGSSDGVRRCGAREAKAREREREREGAHGVEARMASALALSTGGGGVVASASASAGHAASLAWHGRAHAARPCPSAGRPGRLRWLGRLVGAGPLVNSPPFLFF